MYYNKRGLILVFLVLTILISGCDQLLQPLNSPPIAGSGTYFTDGTNNPSYAFSGSVDNVSINSTSGRIRLSPGSSSGVFLSQIFDASSNINWNTMTWASSGVGQLPNNNSNGMNGNLFLVHFNEPFGTTGPTTYQESSGNNYNVECQLTSPPACPTILEGKFGNGAEFAGVTGIATGSSVRVGNPADFQLTGASTLEAWVFPRSNPTLNVAFIGKQQFSPNRGMYLKQTVGSVTPRYSYTISSDCSLQLDSGTSAELPINQWYHLVGVYEPNNRVAIYVNGQLANQVTTGVPASQCNSGVSVFTIGSRSDNVDNQFKGTIDEVALYNRALSASEIQEHYLTGAAKLNLSYRTCNDNACAGETFTNIGTNSPVTLSAPSNRFFQYGVEFTSTDVNSLPEFNNITVGVSNAGSFTNPDAPVISNVLDGPDPVTKGQNIVINASVVPNVGSITSVNVTIDSTTTVVMNLINGATYAATIGTSSLNVGTHDYYITARDNLGNTAQSSSNTFNVVTGCSLTGASWVPGSFPTAVKEIAPADVVTGTPVQLIVNGTNCNGEAVSFGVREDDTIGSGLNYNVADVTGLTLSNAVFSGNQAILNWNAQWVEDSDSSGKNPEYVFRATLTTNTSRTADSSNYLKVTGGDVTAPTFTPSHFPSGNTLFVLWTSSEYGNSTLKYGTSHGIYTNFIPQSSLGPSFSTQINNMVQGITYYYVINVTDESNNTGTSTESSYYYPDTTNPSVGNPVFSSATTPPYQTGYPIRLDVNVTDNIAVSSVKIQVDSTTYNLTPEPLGGPNNYRVILDTTGWSIGLHPYTITANDTSNNINNSRTGNLNIVADTTAPVISNLSHAPVLTTATITWDTNEAANSRVYYGTTPGVYTGNQISGILETHHQILLSGLTSGTQYYYVVNSSDASGNSNASSEQTFTTLTLPDFTPPILSNFNVVPSFASVAATWTTNENATTEVNYSLTAGGPYTLFNISTLSENHIANINGLSSNTQYFYKLVSRDASGNVGSTTESSFTTTAAPDTTNPIITNVVDNSPVGVGENFTLNSDVTDNSGSITFVRAEIDNTVNFTMNNIGGNTYRLNRAANTFGVGNHSYKVYAKDPSNNTQVFGPVSFTVNDCTITSASWNQATANNGQNVGFTINGNNCNNVPTAIQIFEADTFPDPDDVVTTNPGLVTFVGASASGNWVAEWQNDCNGLCNPPEYYIIATSLLGSGSNVNTEGTNELKVYNTTNIPVVTLNSPANGTSFTPGNVNFDCSAGSNNDIQSVSLIIDGLTAASGTFPGTDDSSVDYTPTVSVTNAGAHTWNCQFTDNLGGSASSTVGRSFVILDTGFPVISNVVDNPDSVTQGNTITISADVTDNVQVTNVRVEVDGTTNITMIPFSGSTYQTTTAPTTVLGTHNYKIIAFDNSGNKAELSGFSYTVTSIPDTTAPIISGITTSNIGINSALVSWTTNEAANSRVYYGTTPGVYANSIQSPTLTTNHAINLTSLINGTTYFYIVSSTDSSNNNANSSENSFTTAQTTPIIPPTQFGISGILVSSIGESSATITWNTGLNATGIVKYGVTSGGNYINSASNLSYTSSHSIPLNGLSSGTTYYFVVNSSLANGTSLESLENSFVTNSPSTEGGSTGGGGSPLVFKGGGGGGGGTTTGGTTNQGTGTTTTGSNQTAIVLDLTQTNSIEQNLNLGTYSLLVVEGTQHNFIVNEVTNANIIISVDGSLVTIKNGEKADLFVDGYNLVVSYETNVDGAAKVLITKNLFASEFNFGYVMLGILVALGVGAGILYFTVLRGKKVSVNNNNNNNNNNNSSLNQQKPQ